MSKQVNFAVVNDGEQEMIINFYPPLVLTEGDAARVKKNLGASLTKITGSFAVAVEFDEEAIAKLIYDHDNTRQYVHHTVFGSELTATFDKVGVRLQVKNGSMVFISASAQDAMIAIKPGH